MGDPTVPAARPTAHKTSGARAPLAVPLLYELIQKLLGGHRARKRVVEQHVRPRAGMRVLDIGCGTGQVVAFLPQVTYTGFDLSPRYIAAAQRRFGHKAAFFCADVTTTKDIVNGKERFDRVLALGVIHHLDDDGVKELIRLARRAMPEGGRFISLDPLATEAQSWLGRLLIQGERGRYVRSLPELQRLFAGISNDFHATVYPRLLGYPYHHVVMEAW